MTSQSTNIKLLLSRLTSESTHYYIEQKEISSKESFDGHTIYSRFKRFDGCVTDTLLEQHIRKDINLAIPLNSGLTIFEYAGEHMVTFATLLFLIAREFKIENLIITSYSQEKIVILLLYNEYNRNTIEDFLNKIRRVLEAKLPDEWEIYPKKNRPEIGNLLHLPREIIEFDSF